MFRIKSRRICSKPDISTMASSIPWKFILTKVGIPLTDVVTDTKTGYNYIEKGEKLWGASILSAMVCPLILVLIHELVRYVYRIRHNYSHNDPVNPQWTRLKILSQIPFFGQLLHVYFAHRIKVENQINFTRSEYSCVAMPYQPLAWSSTSPTECFVKQQFVFSSWTLTES